eukprot:NODE_1713_length_1431_cov_100.059334_g1545_i0.p1 GENE.NODE_1713_length_1431_cov_100.059334_g1545_i0~~NODE_1713_length_1431_cov_100.059334_g1545_i0.p1  ORF type:complete len:397 (+),score=35.82 NODE_1713_length_1431_cov_100.059334_g1545_i0:125-1315(+)
MVLLNYLGVSIPSGEGDATTPRSGDHGECKILRPSERPTTMPRPSTRSVASPRSSAFAMDFYPRWTGHSGILPSCEPTSHRPASADADAHRFYTDRKKGKARGPYSACAERSISPLINSDVRCSEPDPLWQLTKTAAQRKRLGHRSVTPPARWNSPTEFSASPEALEAQCYTSPVRSSFKMGRRHSIQPTMLAGSRIVGNDERNCSERSNRKRVLQPWPATSPQRQVGVKLSGRKGVQTMDLAMTSSFEDGEQQCAEFYFCPPYALEDSSIYPPQEEVDDYYRRSSSPSACSTPARVRMPAVGPLTPGFYYGSKRTFNQRSMSPSNRPRVSKFYDQSKRDSGAPFWFGQHVGSMPDHLRPDDAPYGDAFCTRPAVVDPLVAEMLLSTPRCAPSLRS